MTSLPDDDLCSRRETGSASGSDASIFLWRRNEQTFLDPTLPQLTKIRLVCHLSWAAPDRDGFLRKAGQLLEEIDR